MDNSNTKKLQICQGSGGFPTAELAKEYLSTPAKEKKMNNAERFKQVFGLYATEVWAMPEELFLKWLNSESNYANTVIRLCSDGTIIFERGETNG